jgi:hypothetical protein
LIGHADTRLMNQGELGQQRRPAPATAIAMPRFRPDSSEDSLFLPRCRHGERSFSTLGLANWGDCRMIVNASGRSALIVAAGLLVLLANPVTAATDSENSAPDSKSVGTAIVTHRTYRHASHHRRGYAHRRSHAIATKADDKDTDKVVDKKTTTTVTADAAPDDRRALPAMSPSIANANAQMLLAGVQLNAAAAIPSGADVPATASDNQANATADNATFVVAADQLNDVDKTLQESNSTSTAPVAATTTSQPPALAATTTATMTSESTAWDQTSLIGKIFIGFGALLTMASAARMFIG